MIDSVKYLFMAAFFALLGACGANQGAGPELVDHHKDEHTGGAQFSRHQFEALGMQVNRLSRKSLSSGVGVNGYLAVPPQNEAKITAMIGANVVSIEVIEGDEVRQGQALAYVSHPNLIKLQMEYINAWNDLQYIEQDYERQKRLYELEINSGKEFQKIASEYRSKRGLAKGYEAQLSLLSLNPEKLQKGDLYERVPVVSPISGFVQSVQVKTGQFVEPAQVMFETVNIDHIHADLMVFEKDAHKVKTGQKVVFAIESAPGAAMTAVIFNVGKTFETDPKAVHIHADIDNKQGLLLPGMYVQGRILTDSTSSYALPEKAVIREGETFYAFAAEEGSEGVWVFEPVEVLPGESDNGWLPVRFMQAEDTARLFAINNAYYLMAELKKGEAGHSH